jgi:hypothetical protein
VDPPAPEERNLGDGKTASLRCGESEESKGVIRHEFAMIIPKDKRSDV